MQKKRTRSSGHFDLLNNETPCSHGGNHTIVSRRGNIVLSCCGKGSKCKELELNRISLIAQSLLIQEKSMDAEIVRLRKELKSKNEEIYQLSSRLAISESRSLLLENQIKSDPKVVNNYQYTDQSQTLIVNNFVKEKVTNILMDGIKGINPYDSAINHLKALPQSKNRDRMLALAYSNDQADVLNFKREVVELLEDGLETFEVEENQKKEIKKALIQMDHAISKDAAAYGIVELGKD